MKTTKMYLINGKTKSNKKMNRLRLCPSKSMTYKMDLSSIGFRFKA